MSIKSVQYTTGTENPTAEYDTERTAQLGEVDFKAQLGGMNRIRNGIQL